MMTIKTLYFSPTGTTKIIVDTIARTLGAVEKNYNITLPKQRGVMPSFNEDDILIVGLPVYAGRIPQLITEQITAIKGNQTPVIMVGVYGNRDYDDALLEMKNTFQKNGFVPLAAGAFIGEHSYTSEVGTKRPDSRDLKICKQFGETIKTLLKSDTYKTKELYVKGNFPYRELKPSLPLGPIVDETCLNCGICAINCPTGALKHNGHIKVIDELCIRCHACVRKCPIHAVDFDERLDPVKKWLIDNSSKRREPELFYLKDK
ncbi:MAG: 4Fe-4S binding protein [Clostridiales bacterium]|nr:4Fe-4S binding protein [Clostridiales bacterium]